MIRTIAAGYDCVDVNHAQLLENDTQALISEHGSSQIIWYNFTHHNLDKRSVVFTIGGDDGTWPIVDFDHSVQWPPGTSVWKGQHNAEYMGEDEIWMMDNLGLGNVSRLLIARLDHANHKVYLEWEYNLGVKTHDFGDADPTPSGNVLGAFWASKWGPKTRLGGSAQAGLVEVTRDSKEVAWQLLVQGFECSSSNGICDHCDSDDDDDFDDFRHDKLDDDSAVSDVGGWLIYSAERFYTRPVLPSPNSKNRPHCHDGQLYFTVFNSYKQSTRFPGYFEVKEDKDNGEILAAGDFMFKAHWRPTEVKTSISYDGLVQLKVTNQRGRSVTQSLTCY